MGEVYKARDTRLMNLFTCLVCR